MSDQSRIEMMLEEMLSSGSAPEEVCRRSPELLPVLSERWALLHGLKAKLDTIFPPSNPDGMGRHTSPLKRRPEIQGYQIGEILGRGAVGVVYKATHVKLNREVALKMLLSGIYASALELRRFTREAQTIASLRHVNLVQVYDVGDVNGCPYFTMEYVSGGNLAQQLQGVPLPSKKASALMSLLAEAIQVAHAGGIVHRDLKPSNILLTSKGVPKISDFGLARRIEETSDITRSGERVGTACYMAPEQALGRANTVGASADIYSLGAILYEMLTGRPPFQGETAGETERQLLSTDPVPPSRLNPKIPRDLETICLKCLQKDINRRYTSARNLADDLERFKRGEPVLARRVGLAERTLKRVKRHPAPTVAIFGTALFLLTLTGWCCWALAQHTATQRAISEDLHQVVQDEHRAAWADARLCQERVNARLNSTTSVQLRRQAEQNDKDLAMVDRLDSIRLAKSPLLLHEVNDMAFRSEYKAAFADAGYGTPDDPPEQVANRINGSNIKAPLLDAIYNWTASAEDKRLVKWLNAILVISDPTPHPWIVQARRATHSRDQAALIRMLQNAPNDRTCTRLVDTLALRLQDLGADGIPFLKQVLRSHPDDFWTAYDLGICCVKARQWTDAMSAYQIALAIRPGNAELTSLIGVALFETDHKDEALEQMKVAAVLSPDSWLIQVNLANCLCDTGHFSEALHLFERCSRLPHSPFADGSARYAICLDATGNHDAACTRLREAIAINPSVILTGLQRTNLIAEGHADQIQLEWRQSLAKQPFSLLNCDGYAEFCLFLGNQDAYRAACADLLAHSQNISDPQAQERIGRACLLLPSNEQQEQAAVAIIERCVNSDKTKLKSWVPAYFQFSKALADYRLGDWRNALTILHGPAGRVLGPAPALVTAMSEFRLGQLGPANKDLTRAVASYNWSLSSANSREGWIYHILRHEAEAMILSNLPKLASGSYSPTSNDERIAFSGYCQSNGLNLLLCRLYTDAFAADPGLEQDRRLDYRLKASRAAALAGCGIGKDAKQLSPYERKKWRDRAMFWLRADLADLVRTSSSLKAKETTADQLADWRTDRDLAGVRDTGDLQPLDAVERGQWLAFWRDVDSQITALATTQK
jgi:tetratricopeptide (TPR) repeat protein/tRNA A-37 threonylcarbamoyl transferase component Bud32